MKLSCAFLFGFIYLLPLVFAGILKDYNVEKGCGKSDPESLRVLRVDF